MNNELTNYIYLAQHILYNLNLVFVNQMLLE